MTAPAMDADDEIARARFNVYLNELITAHIIPARSPTTVYHYTSHEGLLGILDERAIRASNVRFLNDTTEFELAMRLTRNIIVNRAEHSGTDRELYSRLLAHATTFGGERTFVLSFSSEPDQLSQWRGYCPDASGYAIGVALRELMAIGNRCSMTIGKVMYEEAEHSRLLNAILDATLAFVRDLNDMDRLSPSQKRFHEQAAFESLLGVIAPMMKDSAFREEHEWRLIALSVTAPHNLLRFRPGRGTLIPYLQVPLQSEGQQLTLNQIVVGPTPHPNAALAALRLKLRQSTIACDSVINSRIPYRSGI